MSYKELMRMESTQTPQVVVPNDDLFDLIREHAPDQVKHVAEVLAPFYAIAESGEYPLKPKEELNAQEIIDAVNAVAVRQTASSVAFFSLSEPFPRPRWMKEFTIEELVDLLLIPSMGDRLNELTLSPIYEEWARCIVRACQSKESVIGQLIRLTNNFLHPLCAVVTSITNKRFSGLFSTALNSTIVRYLGFLMAGDSRFEGYERLLRLYGKCIPCSWKKDEPEILVVLCA